MLVRRLTVLEYMTQVRDSLRESFRSLVHHHHQVITNDLQDIILQYVKPGFLCPPTKLQDFFYLNYFLRNSLLVSDSPLHFLQSRFHDVQLKELMARFHDISDSPASQKDIESYVLNNITKYLQASLFFTEDKFYISSTRSPLSKSRSTITNYNVYYGEQTFFAMREAFAHGFSYDFKYIGVTVDGNIICEMSIGDPLSHWGSLNEELCITCSTTDEKDEDDENHYRMFYARNPPRGRSGGGGGTYSRSRYFSCRLPNRIEWLYCNQCRAGPFCSTSCISKCQHLGFVCQDA